jgi:hypothetical protein
MEMAMMAFPNPQDGMGVLAYLISKGKYEEFYRQRHGCGPDSGEELRTPIPVYKSPKIPAVGEYDDSTKGLSKFKMAQEEWSRESSAVQDFRAKLLASLDEIALSAIGTPDQRQTKTLAEIFSALDVRFSRVTPAELGREIRKIRTPLSTIPDFEKVITAHHSLHQICADQKCERTENDKIFDLQTALENQPEMQIVFNLFDREHELQSPQRTFAEFTRQLRLQWQNNMLDRPDPTATTAAYGYANSLSKRKSEDTEPMPSQEAINRGIEALAKLGYSLSTKPSNPTKKPKRPKVYCEVHGLCNHTTEECRDGSSQPAKASSKSSNHKFPQKGDLKTK